MLERDRSNKTGIRTIRDSSRCSRLQDRVLSVLHAAAEMRYGAVDDEREHGQ